MAVAKFRTDVLNPCPGCGRRFDIGGCITYVVDFLEAAGGRCSERGAQVLVRVPAGREPDTEIWRRAATLPEIRAVRAADLVLSVRARYVLRDAGLRTVGELLDAGDAGLRRVRRVTESVIRELRRLLAEKGLTLREDPDPDRGSKPAAPG